MDDDLEVAWRREQEVAEAWHAREKALGDAEETLAVLRQRQADGPVSSWAPPAPKPPKPVQRTVAPRERSVVRAAIDWDKTAAWVREIIDGRVGKSTNAFVTEVTTSIAGEAGTIIREVQDRLEARIAGLEAAVAALRAEIAAERAARAVEAKYAALEARLAEAEQRGAVKPAKPKLVDDNAA